MSENPSFFETLRAIDDAGLDVYEYRLWMHIWRVGASWESIRTLSAKCNMSLAKVHQVRKSLLDRNLLALTETNGRIALTVVFRSPDEQSQQDNRSPREHNVHETNEHSSSDDAIVRHTNNTFATRTQRSPHEQNVRHTNAILSKPLEDKPLEGGGDCARVREQPKPQPSPAPPPPSVKTRPRGQPTGGYPPDAPVPSANGKGEHKNASPERLAIGEMANAITAVTGIAARLNWKEVGELATDLVAAGYTPKQLHTHYGREPTPGAWHWYEMDWRGKRGDRPHLKGIRETIEGAVQSTQTPARKLTNAEKAMLLKAQKAQGEI